MPDDSKQGGTERLTAHQIFESAVQLARDELERHWTELSFSGIAGGVTMGLTGLSAGLVVWVLGPGATSRLIAAAVYPVGFMAVIIGRAQLFTENTLYPVVLVLKEKRHIAKTLRLWGVVFAGNLVGAAIFAVIVSKTEALPAGLRDTLIAVGMDSPQHPFSAIFWSGVVGGWLVALVAWLVTASHWTTGQAMMVWAMTFILGLGHFSHCIASSGEILSAVFSGSASFGQYAGWLAAATLGNIVGGIGMVSLLNYGQVQAGQAAEGGGGAWRRTG